jgi:hypothetical protein
MNTFRNLNQRNKVLVLSGAGLLLIAAVVALTWALIPNTGSKNARAALSPMPEVTPTEDALTKNLREALENPNLSDEERTSLQEKLRMSERSQNQQAARGDAQGPKDAPTQSEQSLLPQGQALQPVEDEIIEGSEGVVESWVAEIQNLWQGERDGIYYQILAGAEAEDTQQGILILIEIHPGLISRNQTILQSPQKNGALRILSVEGYRMELVDQAENHLTFDIQKREFVTSE